MALDDEPGESGLGAAQRRVATPLPESYGDARGARETRVVRGCLGCFSILVILAVAGAIALSNFHPLGEPPRGIAVDASWASRDIVLTPDTPTASIRVTVSYKGDTYNTIAAISVGVPRDTSTATPDASSAFLRLLDPAIGLAVPTSVNGYQRDCYAACEAALSLPSCPDACTQTYDVRLQLVDAAGRDSLTVTVRAGATSLIGYRLPDGFAVRIDAIASIASSRGAA